MLRIEEGALCDSWQGVIGDQFDQPYMQELLAFLGAEKRSGKTIYPADADIFNALNHTSFEDVGVVIIGQDPYHGAGQAHGLCFSVQDGVALPPSLKNMYKELHSDIGMEIPVSGNLLSWADQGVLLLNAVLTVEQAQAGAHQGMGWEAFTDHIIQVLNERRSHLVFLLWGSYAQKKGRLIDRERHCVLEGPHPSPLSAYRGFFGCQHFSKANTYLNAMGKKPINWASIL
jgi:uracil-DNA glycosylase